MISAVAVHRSIQPDARPVVLFLIHDLRLGGAERAMVSYVNHVQRVRPVVAVLRPRGDLLHELAPSIPVFDLQSRSVPAAGDHRSAFGDDAPDPAGARPATQGWSDDLTSLVRKTVRLQAVAEHCGAAAIASFLHKSHVLALAARTGMSRRVRLIANVHELVGPHLVHHHGWRDRLLLRAFVRHGFPRFDRIIAVAAGVRQDLVRGFGLPAHAVEVHHPPLNLERIRRAATGSLHMPLAGAGEPLVVAVGRLVRLKGFDVLLRAFAALDARHRARLVIVGEGEERASLERLIDQLGVRASVALVGSQENPWAYMKAATVVVLASRTEAFPTVLGEAMTLERPVIATDCSPGVREYVEDGRCGMLIPPDDPSAMAAALEALLVDRGLRDGLAAAGARRAETLELRSAVRHYENMLLDVLTADPSASTRAATFAGRGR